MKLQYGLIDNHLTPDPTDFMATTQNVRSYTLQDILEEMVVPGGVTSTQAAAVLESFTQATEKILKDGHGINTELYNISPSISGVFTSAEDSFDSGRHSIKLNMNLGKRLKKVIPDIQVEKVVVTSPQPVIKSFTDSATHRINEVISRGKVGEIKGINLKLNTEDKAQGVFFISETGEVRAENYIRNKPGDLLFFIPENLPDGKIEIEVRTVFTGGKVLKTTRFNESLSAI